MWGNFDAEESNGILNASEAKYRALFDQMSEGFAFHEIIYDSKNRPVDYRIIDVNPAFERHVGISASKAKGNLATYVYGSTSAPFINIYNEVAETGENQLFQVYFEPLDRQFEISVFSPRRGYFAAVFSDITERKLVADSQTFLLKCGLPSTGEDYFLSMARYLAQTLRMEYICIDRLEGDGLTAQTVAVYNEGKFESNVRYALKDTPCGRVVSDRVCCYLQGVQSLFPLDEALHELNAESYYGTTLWDSKGKPIGLIAIIGHRPMTDSNRAETLLKLIAPHAAAELERRQAEQELKTSKLQLHELNATKDKFFSIIAHDLKSPFNTIVGFSDLLLEQIRSNEYEEIEKYAEIILQSSYRAMDLLSNLLEWSRAQTGRLQFNPLQTNLYLLIRDAVDLLNETAQQKSITIQIKASKVLLGFADVGMIKSVLRNLLSNAIKFTYNGGVIEIVAEEKQNEIVVFVRDNGIGIRENEISKLFKIDETYSSPGTNSEKGTGLGLILSKGFIEKHAGKIWVESDHGKGSTFYFSIPSKA